MPVVSTAVAPGSIKESYVDVLVIGSGPAGVMFANALAGTGVTTRIVEKRSKAVVRGQADACQPRTLEIMQSYGLAEKLFKRGESVWKAAFYNPDYELGIKRTAYAGIINARTPRWPFINTLNQGDIERVFLESMHEKGLEVQYGTIPTFLEISKVAENIKSPTKHVVKVVLEQDGENGKSFEIVHAKFLLGADGAHSWVRKTLGIDMQGDMTDSVWGVVDILPDTDFPDTRNLTFVHSHAGTLFIIPRENDQIRLYIQQSAKSKCMNPVTGRADKDRTSPEQLLEEGRKILWPYRMEVKDEQISWWTVYVVGQGVAERYSIYDRVFIAGDACHTHSPKAGQGLNASMGDTHNLAWKITYVLKGWARMCLLKTYESERRTYAQNLINFDKNWSKLFSEKPRTDENLDGVTHDEFISMFKGTSEFTSGVGIHYDSSCVINGEHQCVAANLIVGERVIPHIFVRAADSRPVELQDLLPADMRFKILVFAGDIANEEEHTRLQKLADNLDAPDSFLCRFGRRETEGLDWKIFDILCLSSATRDEVDHSDFPEFFRPHWSKVLLDDSDIHGRSGGGGYKDYGIDPHVGAIVVVRPDGYVGTVAPFDDISFLNSYFSSFLI